MQFGRGLVAAAAVAMLLAGVGHAALKTLFNGTSFDGWEGNQNWFHIVDGTIVGGSLSEGLKQNEFLVTTRQYGDFELRVTTKLTAGKGNGGVQFRSQRVPGSREMNGYQADASTNFWGGLWDESRRKRFLGTRLNEAEMKQALKPDGWNAYVIRAEGPHIQIWLNGVKTLDYVEDDQTIPRTGYVGVQIHSGEPSQASYKDIAIEELK